MENCMSIDLSQPSQEIPGERKNTSRPKRIWLPHEDAVLVEALVEMSKDSYWKAENGFRAGHLVALEKEMAKKIKDCTLKAQPHIESRVRTLKKLTVAIAEMLVHSSGFSWNDDDKMIICEKIVFDDWVKSHPNAAGLRNRPFPHYDALCEVFGKDRATGQGAEHATDAQEEIESVSFTQEQEGGSCFMDFFQHLDLNESLFDHTVECDSPASHINQNDGTSSNKKRQRVTDIPDSPPTHSHNGGASSSSTVPKTTSRKKRPRVGDGPPTGISDIAETFKEFVIVTKEVVNISRERVQIMNGPTQQRLMAMDELMKLEGLTHRERNLAGLKLGADDAVVNMFLRLPEVEREEFIRDVLRL